MSVPFYSGAKSIRRDWPRISELLDSFFDGGLTNGLLVREFEREVEKHTGASHAIAVNSATDALIIMLKASGIGEGDEVIVPSYTFFASASSIHHVGAKPVFVDIDPDTYNIDPTAIEAKLTAHTRAVMPVHLFTQMADMPAILEVASRNDLMVLEDSAEAIGMWCEGRHAGLVGRAGVLSFFPTKTLGALGDAGMILTDDGNLAELSRMLRVHGQSAHEPYVYNSIGYNSRMDDVQAAILIARLGHLKRDIAERKAIACLYDERLGNLAPWVRTPKRPQRSYATDGVHYVYLIEAEDRDGLVVHLHDRGVGTEVYYPTPLHLQPCFESLGYGHGDFPHAERASTRAVGLPLYSDLSVSQVEEVCDAIESFYATVPSYGKGAGRA